MRLFADTAPLQSTDFRRLWASGIVTTIGASLTFFRCPGSPRVRRQGAAVIVAILVWGVTVIGFGWASGASHGRAGLLLWAALGFLAVGGAAALVGTSAAVVWGGVLVVVGVLIAALAAPAFARYRAP